MTIPRLLVLLAWPQIVIVSADAPAKRLQRILPLPEHSLSRAMKLDVGIGYDPFSGFKMSGGDQEHREALAESHALRTDTRRRVGSAQEYHRLGALLQELHEAGGREALERAVRLYARRAAAQPQDGALLSEYGGALADAGRQGKAEKVLRKATTVAPARWQAWAALADFLQSRAYTRLGKPIAGRKPLATALVAQTRRDIAEALACDDRAVAVAPGEARAYAGRGQFRAFDLQTLRGLLATAQGRAAPPFSPSVPPQALRDFFRAAELRPEDPDAVALPVWVEAASFGFGTLHGDFPSRGAWRSMPSAQRRRAGNAMRRLRELAGDSNRRRSARALAALGFLDFECRRDALAATRHLRQALACDAHCAEAAEMLMHVYSLQEQYARLALFCRRRLGREGTARLHVICAYAYAKQKRWHPAVAQARQAQSLEPHDAAAVLLLAVCRMKAADDPETLAAVGALLEAQDRRPMRRTAGLAEEVEFALTRGICFALQGHSGQARQSLELALRQNPADVAARRALALIPSGG